MEPVAVAQHPVKIKRLHLVGIRRPAALQLGENAFRGTVVLAPVVPAFVPAMPVFNVACLVAALLRVKPLHLVAALHLKIKSLLVRAVVDVAGRTIRLSLVLCHRRCCPRILVVCVPSTRARLQGSFGLHSSKLQQTRSHHTIPTMITLKNFRPTVVLVKSAVDCCSSRLMIAAVAVLIAHGFRLKRFTTVKQI
jgi:hypothetical protein